MATSGKGKRKTKGKTLDLNSFLSAHNESAPEGYTAIPNVSWTTLMDDETNDPFHVSNEKPQVILPTAPKSSRPPNIDLTKIPPNGPFKAHLANLPYDISEDDIVSFFRKLEIKEVQLPRDGTRLKGFGYAEFHDRDTLIEALNFNNETLKNRSIMVSLPSSDGNDERRPYRARGGDDHRREREEPREDRTDENWRSQNQRPALNEQRFNSRNGDHNTSRGGFDSNRRGGDRGDRDRDFDRFADRRRDRQFGSNFTRDRQSPTPLAERDLERSQEADVPKERKKLALKPRTVKTEEEHKEEMAKNSSIFGDAKPVDTTAREREVEEKLAKKEEHLDKVDSIRRDSESEHDKSQPNEGRRSRKVSETGSSHHEENKHIDPPPRRFDDRPNYRKSNFEHRDNRPPIRQRDYDHDSFRRTDGESGYGFKNRSRDNDNRFDSYNRNRNNYSNEHSDMRRNNKTNFGYNNNSNNRFSHSNRRDYGNEGERNTQNRNYNDNNNHHSHHHENNNDSDEQNRTRDENDKELKSANKFDLLDNDVDIDGASH